MTKAEAQDRPPRRPTAADGLLVIDKPAGWTSHDVVARARGLCGTRKVGHAGTLDPMATGVLVLGVGRATRLLTYVVGADKEYRATIRLGVSTNTDDADGEVTARVDVAQVPLSDQELAAAVDALTGDIQQVPSAVSAIKVDGQRAYARVRAGEDVQLAARPVMVHEFEVSHLEQVPDVNGSGMTAVDVLVRVVCSSGTYIRALARDLGTALGVGGHLTMLRRSRVGGYALSAAHSLTDLAAWPMETALETLPLADAARAIFPVRDLTAHEARAVGNGQRITASAVVGSPVVAAIGPGGELVALLEDRGPQARPVVVFASGG